MKGSDEAKVHEEGERRNPFYKSLYYIRASAQVMWNDMNVERCSEKV